MCADFASCSVCGGDLRGKFLCPICEGEQNGSDAITTDLVLKLRSETNGGAAYEVKEKLITLSARGDELAARGLADYAFDGQHDHIRESITSDLSELAIPGGWLGSFFLRALEYPVCSLWASKGAVRVLGRQAYPTLADFVLDPTNSLEARAAAIKVLANHSGTHFDEGLSADPGFWREEDLRLNALREWAAKGYPESHGYQSPTRHPSLERH